MKGCPCSVCSVRRYMAMLGKPYYALQIDGGHDLELNIFDVIRLQKGPIDA